MQAANKTAASNMAAMRGQRYDVPYSDLNPTEDKGRAFAKSPWLALMNAGFGMMAGTSPYAGVNIGKGHPGIIQHRGHQRGDPFGMGARRNFGNHPAIGAMGIVLRGNALGYDPALAIHQRRRRFVTGRFNSEDNRHPGFSLVRLAGSTTRA